MMVVTLLGVLGTKIANVAYASLCTALLLRLLAECTQTIINLNKLDNRRCNLRVCTTGENRRNQAARRDSSIGYKGVTLDKRDGVYMARIMKAGKAYSLGRFITPEAAANAYLIAALKLHGEFAYGK